MLRGRLETLARAQAGHPVCGHSLAFGLVEIMNMRLIELAQRDRLVGQQHGNVVQDRV